MNLDEEINYFQQKANYFRNIGFSHLADDFERVVKDLLNLKNNEGKS